MKLQRLLGALTAAAAVASCNAVLDIEEGDPRVASSFCTGKAEGTPSLEQTKGDCVEEVCDGNGKLKVVTAESDVADDGNPCTLDHCVGSVVEHTPLTEVACYTGPAGTAGVGTCKKGIQQCDPQGNLIGGCTGQALPQAEVCKTLAVDDDCDGTADEEGADCKCGDGIFSKDVGEQCDDGGTADGDPCSPTCQDQQVLQISTAHNSSCVRTSYLVKCWGQNEKGQLGLGDTKNRGDDDFDMGVNLLALDLGTKLKIIDIATGGAEGGSHACALLSDGTIRCWGASGLPGAPHGDQDNEMGSHLPVVDLGEPATAITASASHTCALLSSGDVKCWGENADGQLGLGHTTPLFDTSALAAVKLGTNKKATAITAGRSFTCALLSEGSVKCWGMGGIIGQGDGDSRGNDPDEMGDALLPVALGTGQIATAIEAGTSHACAVLSDQMTGEASIKCWGRNDNGQLGQEDFNWRGSKSNEMGDMLPAVKLGAGTTPKAVTAGYDHTCALFTSGAVKCWGGNWSGSLGLGTTSGAVGSKMDEMGDNLLYVKLGPDKIATAITAGYLHTCALFSDSSVKCWGVNFSGLLGLGDIDTRGDGLNEMGDALLPVKLFSDIW